MHKRPTLPVRPDPKVLLDKIMDIEFMLSIDYAPEYRVPMGTPSRARERHEVNGVEIVWRPITPDKRENLKVRVTLLLKLLNKCLPDLKSIDIFETGEAGTKATDVQALARKIQGLAAVTGKPVMKLIAGETVE